jgi:hypothetical protein
VAQFPRSAITGRSAPRRGGWPRFSRQLARSTPPFNNGVYKLRSEALADFLDEWEAKQDRSPLMSWPRLPRSFASRRQRTISRRRERTRCRRCGAPPRRSRHPLSSATRRRRTPQELTAVPAPGHFPNVPVDVGVGLAAETDLSADLVWRRDQGQGERASSSGHRSVPVSASLLAGRPDRPRPASADADPSSESSHRSRTMRPLSAPSRRVSTVTAYSAGRHEPAFVPEEARLARLEGTLLTGLLHLPWVGNALS